MRATLVARVSRGICPSPGRSTFQKRRRNRGEGAAGGWRADLRLRRRPSFVPRRRGVRFMQAPGGGAQM